MFAWCATRHRESRVVAGAMVLATMLAAAPALAQAPPPNLREVPQGSPIPRVLPPAPPATAPGTALPALPPPSAEVPNRTVKVTSVAVVGVTAFPLPAIVRFTTGLTGPAVPLTKIDASRQAILQYYRSSGYVLSTVSANLDTSGVLHFVVTEGHIASVKLDGNIGPAGVQVLRFLRRLTEVTPIDSKTLERYLLLAEDVPGVSLRAVLQPSTDQPGALTLIAQVSRKPVSGLVTFDNRAFNQTGPIEGLGVVDFNSFTDLGEKTELTYYHTFPNSQNFGQLSEEFFIGSSGLKLKLYGGEGNAIPTGGGTSGLAANNYRGFTDVFGGELSYPVIRSRQQTLDVYLGLDALESTVRIGTPPAVNNTDSLRVVRFGEDYALSDLWLGNERPATDSLTFRVSRGLQVLGADANGDSDAPRTGEQTNFTKINFQAVRTQTLFPVGASSSVGLMELLAGQWSDDILPSAEQFYLGGSQYTRGYYAGQIPGDKGLAWTTELQFNTGTDLSMWGLSANISTQFYAFYDWGEVWQNQPTDFATHVASAGGGVRMQVTQYVEVDFEALDRMNRYPTGSGTNISALNAIGLYWRVVTHF